MSEQTLVVLGETLPIPVSKIGIDLPQYIAIVLGLYAQFDQACC